jgi:hypothetical protein
VRAFLTLVMGAVLLGGCAAKQKAVSAQAVSAQEDKDRAAGKPLATDASKMGRESSPGAASEDYERAVANYNDCFLDHTANLSACEKQRLIMDRLGEVSSRSP